jgi:hypothetical protein
VVNIQIEVLWVVTPCNVVVGYIFFVHGSENSSKINTVAIVHNSEIVSKLRGTENLYW